MNNSLIMRDLEAVKLTGFGHYLVANGYINEEQACLASSEAMANNGSFIVYLAQNKLAHSQELAKVTANYFDLPYFDLNSYDLNDSPKNILSVEFIQKYSVFPLIKREHQLILAVLDPSIVNLNEVNFITGLVSVVVIVEAEQLTRLIHGLHSKQLQMGMPIEALQVPTDIDELEGKAELDVSSLYSEQTPLVRFLNNILREAINKHASDIHFEPYEKFYRIRFRLDGVLYEVNKLPVKLSSSLTARLKIMACLDISEKRLPQDGRFKLEISTGRSIDFRINTCPTLYGEKAVLRILQAYKLLNLNQLGLNAAQKNIFNKTMAYSQGMILVTGPTGSGKTTTLYTTLSRLNKSEINIMSVEDPVEVNLTGINQTQVNLKVGLTFATVLRAFLRQDPDIIMVGEVRDLETADIAIKAAQTGHLVLSTLHTNSATETLLRLSAMGVSSYNIINSIILIIAQRLVRRLCNYCKISVTISDQVLLDEGFLPKDLNNLTVCKAYGCRQCLGGYKGRIGIYEVLPLSKEMMKLMLGNATPLVLAKQAREENIPTLRQEGLNKVRQGLTSLDELNRVIQE